MRRQLIAALVAVSLSFGTLAGTGCYGSFQMTQSLHDWNGRATDSKFVNWLLFVGLVIVPVYELSLLVDGFVFNSIEFWTGQNPVRSGRLVIDQNGTLTASLGDRQLELRPGPDGALELVEDGALVARAIRHESGAVSIYGADGALVQRLDVP
jgi:hypothetical protein